MFSSTGPDGNTLFRAFDPAVAYNPAADGYLVVWRGQEDFGSLINGEDEIFGQRLDAVDPAVAYNPAADDFRISDMGPDGDRDYEALGPAVAYNPSANQYLVVWSGDDDTPPLVDEEFEVFGQRLLFVVPHDVGLVDTSQGLWYMRDHRDASVTTFFFGNPGDRPVVGDWDGMGDETSGLFRASDGFFYGRNTNNAGIADFSCFAGIPSDVALGGTGTAMASTPWVSTGQTNRSSTYTTSPALVIPVPPWGPQVSASFLATRETPPQ